MDESIVARRTIHYGVWKQECFGLDCYPEFEFGGSRPGLTSCRGSHFDGALERMKREKVCMSKSIRDAVQKCI